MNFATLRLIAGSYVPRPFHGTGGTNDARYCYSVWLRHLHYLAKHGIGTRPRNVCELGPGDTLGIGIAALLSGSETYVGLDVVEHCDLKRNRRFVTEIGDLYKARAPIPGNDEFPSIKPAIPSLDFPVDVLTDERLADAMRYKPVEEGIYGPAGDAKALSDPASRIRYSGQWTAPDAFPDASFDMVFSQAVMEHVDDLPKAYLSMAKWLRPGGVISHQIDFKSHGTSSAWNGHWTYSPLTWRLIRGMRPYLINREPLSTHLDMMRRHGFEVLETVPAHQPGGVGRERLHRTFAHLSEQDFTTSGAYVLARKSS